MITKEEVDRVLEYRDGKLYWKISHNQDDTGSIGVRLECMHYPGIRPHYMTAHPDLVEKYVRDGKYV